MKRHLAVAAVLALGFLICSGISLAQEEEETVEETDYSWGTVSSVSSGQIVITEYDYDTDEKVEVTYSIDPNVKLHNVNSLKEIAVGNDIWIDYVIREDKNVAMGIEVKKPSDEEEYTPEKTYEEEPEYYPDETEY